MRRRSSLRHDAARAAAATERKLVVPRRLPGRKRETGSYQTTRTLGKLDHPIHHGYFGCRASRARRCDPRIEADVLGLPIRPLGRQKAALTCSNSKARRGRKALSRFDSGNRRSLLLGVGVGLCSRCSSSREPRHSYPGRFTATKLNRQPRRRWPASAFVHRREILSASTATLPARPVCSEAS